MKNIWINRNINAQAVQKVSVLLLMLLPVSMVKAQKQDEASFWLQPQDVQNRNTIVPRPILIDVYTGWCVYCKAMDKQTWRNKQVKDYLSAHFYPLKLDAESKDTIKWMGNVYAYQPKYKVHMLAAHWLQGNMVYPSTVVMPPDGEPVILTGFLSARELEPVLRYFGEGHYKHIAWLEFKEKFKSSW